MTIWSNQSNLNRGEIDETLEGRIDTDLYYNSLSKARNVLLTPQGGAKKRAGTRYLDEDATCAMERLEPFSFNNETNYLLAFQLVGSGYRIYIYKDGVLQTDINGSGDDYLSNSVTLAIRAGFYYIQSANTAIIFSAGAPVVLTRTSDTAWSADAITFSNIPQYDFNDASSPTPVDQIQDIVFSSTSASDRYKLSVDGFLSDEVSYSASTSENASRIEDAINSLDNIPTGGVSVAHTGGSTYRITFSAGSAGDYGIVQGVAVITASTSFSAEATVVQAGTSRREDAFGVTRGWPSCGVFHQSRLWMGGTPQLPDSLFGSVVADFFNFDEGKSRDSDSIFVTLQTDQVNEIVSMVSARKLQIYTTGAEFYCAQDIITPSNVSFSLITNYGSGNVKPVTIDGQVLFPQLNSRALILLDVVNQYQPPSSRNIGVLAPHLLSGITSISVSRGNDASDANYIYLLNGDGNITCLNYLPTESVEGYSLWETGGGVKDIAVVDKKLYMINERNGTCFLEVEDDTLTVDCGLTITASQTIDLTHLIGQGDCDVVGDGAYFGEFTPSASTDLGRVVTSGYAGLPFRPTIKLMSIINQKQNGSTYGQKKRIRRGLISVFESNSIKVNGIIIPDKTMGLDVFEAPAPQTGLLRVRLRGYSIDARIEITQEAPLSFYIRSVGVEMKL